MQGSPRTSTETSVQAHHGWFCDMGGRDGRGSIDGLLGESVLLGDTGMARRVRMAPSTSCPASMYSICQGHCPGSTKQLFNVAASNGLTAAPLPADGPKVFRNGVP